VQKRHQKFYQLDQQWIYLSQRCVLSQLESHSWHFRLTPKTCFLKSIAQGQKITVSLGSKSAKKKPESSSTPSSAAGGGGLKLAPPPAKKKDETKQASPANAAGKAPPGGPAFDGFDVFAAGVSKPKPAAAAAAKPVGASPAGAAKTQGQGRVSGRIFQQTRDLMNVVGCCLQTSFPLTRSLETWV